MPKCLAESIKWHSFLQERKGKWFSENCNGSPRKSWKSPQDALWTGGCGDCRPPAPLWGIMTRPEECFFWWSRLVAVRLHARWSLLYLQKAYFGVFLGPQWHPLAASGSWCSPKHLPLSHGGGGLWEWRGPLEINLPHALWHRDAPGWRTKLGSWAGAGGRWQAWWMHGTLCPGLVVSAQTPTQINFLPNWLSNAGSAGGRAWVWSSLTEIWVSDKIQGPNFQQTLEETQNWAQNSMPLAAGWGDVSELLSHTALI